MVKICCYRCRRVLTTVDEVPTDWTGTVEFLRCSKCDLPDPGRIVDVLLKSGLDGFPMLAAVHTADLRESIVKAQRTGRSVRYPVYPPRVEG